jgi:copper(I)-binding protein
LKLGISSIVVGACLGLGTIAASAATGGTETASPARAVYAPQVSDAWARATVPGQPVGAAYMKIDSAVPVTLTHVETDVAKQVQVHNMHMEGGVMKMREHGQLEIPAGKTVALAPGGLHLMLLGLKQPLKAGESVQMTLTFVDANKKKATSVITVPVRPIGK